jgi:hypothetical protein
LAYRSISFSHCFTLLKLSWSVTSYTTCGHTGVGDPRGVGEDETRLSWCFAAPQDHACMQLEAVLDCCLAGTNISGADKLAKLRSSAACSPCRGCPMHMWMCRLTPLELEGWSPLAHVLLLASACC